MAMKMKQLINSMLLIVGVWTLLYFPVADQQEDYTGEIWRGCGISVKNESWTDSAFQRNLNHVLDSLVGNVSPSGFNTTSVDEGQNSNSTVYGLVQCRGDLGSADCKDCAATAKAKLVQDCYNTSGFINLNGCFLRYDSFNFYNDSSDSTRNVVCSKGNASNPEQFTNDAEARLANTSNRAAESPKLFAADSLYDDNSPSYKIYSTAQCNRDMSRHSCNECLADGLSWIIEWCKTGAIGARFLISNCELRFETYPFFNVSILSPAPAPPPSSGKNGSILSPLPSPSPGSSGGKRSNVLRITLGVVASVVGSIAVIGLCKWNFVSRQKRWEQIYGTAGPEIVEEGEISLCPSIANLELIFKYDILREATSNFKEENKLGQGGFGSVYKVSA
jgi:hypothetical protein